VIRQGIEDFKPHVVFNLLEEFAGEAIYDQNVLWILLL
jgi:D-alanine-D-alanine ligase